MLSVEVPEELLRNPVYCVDKIVPTRSIQGKKAFLKVGLGDAKAFKGNVKISYESKVTNPRKFLEGRGLNKKLGTAWICMS